MDQTFEISHIRKVYTTFVIHLILMQFFSLN